MKVSVMFFAFSGAISIIGYAQTPAPAAPTQSTIKSAPSVAPSTTSPAVTAVCKDGSAFSGGTMKGACSGHGGVDKKATKAKAAASQPAVPDKASDKAASKASAPPIAQAPGGSADKVWGNTSSKVYHCPGDKWYGKTKRGEYMSEADAKAKGYHADHGKVCVAK